MSEANPVPSVTFSLSEFARRDRMDVWRDFMSGVFTMEANGYPDDQVFASVSGFDLGNSLLGFYNHSGSVMRSRAVPSALDRKEMLVLGWHRTGTVQGLLNDNRFDMSPSFLTVYDSDQAISAKTTDCEYFDFVFPYSAVGYDPSAHPSFQHFSVSSPLGRILKTSFDLAIDIIPSVSADEAAALADGFCGLLRGLLSDNWREESSRMQFIRAREATIRRFIRDNLKNPNLNSELICRVVGVSRPVLYRIFSEEGGVKKAIQRQRLEGALEELSFTPPKLGAVGRIAYSWAFVDGAQFSRLFRDAFGFRPSDALGSALNSSVHDLYATPNSSLVNSRSIVPLRELYKTKEPG